MTTSFSRTAALLLCVLLLAGAIAVSEAHAAGATAKGGLKVAVDAAQKWQADAVLTGVSAMQVGADGKAAKWDYMFYSPKAKKAYSVVVKNNKVAGTLEVNPHIKDGVGEFVDSDKAIEESKKNGLKGKPDVMSLIVMGQATKNPACYWSIVSQSGSVLFSFVIDGKSGKFSYKQETKM
jgi:hypothetical protein